MRNIIYFVNNTFSYLENSKIPLINIIFSALSSIILRYFFESFSQHSINYFNFQPQPFILNLLHEILFYFLTSILFIIVIHYATRERIDSIFRVVFSSMILLTLAPILDLILSKGAGYDMYYFVPGNVDLLKNFFSYSTFHPGATIGIKIETLIIFFSCFYYLQMKGKNLSFSLAYVLLLYCLVFILSATPSILNLIITWLGFQYEFSNILLIEYFSFLLLLSFLWMLWLANKSLLLYLLMDCRFLRISYYLLMIFFGMIIAFKRSSQSVFTILHTHIDIIPMLFFSLIGTFFAALFTIIFNNIADYPIDLISNPNRPLIEKTIDIKTYQVLGYSSLFISSYYALLGGLKSFFLIFFVVSVYYIYSIPPLRLKRLPIFSKLVISLSSLAFVILGYLIVKKDLEGFPTTAYYIFLIGITLCANVIDIKDQIGDAVDGLKTLPIIIGLKNSKRIIGISFIITYVSFYFLIPNIILTFLFFVLGALQYYLINKNIYDEQKILIVNMITILILIVAYILF